VGGHILQSNQMLAFNRPVVAKENGNTKQHKQQGGPQRQYEETKKRHQQAANGRLMKSARKQITTTDLALKR
jgi:hypothetical protein